jgi:ribose/xylose/arabinose/galactoside ABC-type transport system permease subunit
MICEKFGKDTVTSSSGTVGFLSTFYRKIFVIVFWICLVVCMVGVGFGAYNSLQYTMDTFPAFVVTLLIVVVVEALVILAFGTMAVFLSIQKNIEDLNEKTDDLNKNVNEITKLLFKTTYSDKSRSDVDPKA